MESMFLRRFSIFSLVLILVGLSGINISGAVPSKYTTPAAPTDVHAVGGLEQATLSWKAPYSNGGKAITSYKVTYYPGAKVHICNSAALSCVVDIDNPNKPSSNPPSVWFYFTVSAVNSVGTGPVSIVGQARVLIRFRATIYITPKSGPSTPTPTPTRSATPTPTPSINAIPAPSRTPSSTPTAPANALSTTTYDGTYTGQAVVTVSSLVPGVGNTSTIATTFTVVNGRGQGSADNWTVTGYVTDLAGAASVTVTNPLYGSFPFTVTFRQDPVTKVMNGNGRGVQTFSLGTYGDVTVVFVFSVSRIS